MFKDMGFNLAEFMKTSPVIAVAGATNHTAKFGNIIFRDLLDKGYKVIPVNPRATTIEDIPAWHSLTEAAGEMKIDLVNYVVPPKITNEILEESKSLGITKAWVQPGAGNEQTREFLEKNNFDYLLNACIMVQSAPVSNRL